MLQRSKQERGNPTINFHRNKKRYHIKIKSFCYETTQNTVFYTAMFIPISNNVSSISLIIIIKDFYKQFIP